MQTHSGFLNAPRPPAGSAEDSVSEARFTLSGAFGHQPALIGEKHPSRRKFKQTKVQVLVWPLTFKLPLKSYLASQSLRF